MKPTLSIAVFLSISIAATLAFGQEIRAAALGGVAHPGTYALSKGTRLSSLIERAGGFADGSRPSDASLTRNSIKAARKNALLDLIAKVEAEALADPGEEGPKRAFIEYLSRIEPSGRTKVSLSHLRLLKGSERDLLVEDGDTLFIPAEKAPVTVAGSVRNKDHLAFPHSEKADYSHYIRMAGGYSERADKERIYLMKGDAAAVPLAHKWIRWNPAQSRWEISAFTGNAPRIEPGDTIVVPSMPAPGTWAHGVKNLPDLLMRITAITETIVEAP
ncbi:MAG: SLBB domain-containing protein [Deltaproteobacteria bacterium]|nr:SLBB domain-containing protein [Deltaproteobacteria bacterium]